MPITTLFFDLDDTLYPHSAGLWEAIRHRMDNYMHERLNFSMDEIPTLRRNLLEKYGTTLRGLQTILQIDAQDFLQYVHDIPIHQYLQENPALKKVLHDLPQDRWILTNADHHHAKRVLSALGLLDCFQGIIDVNVLGFIPKPDPASFQKSLLVAKASVDSSVFFDDAVRNLSAASKLGFTTVLVGPTAPETMDGVHYHIQKLEELPSSLPWLWENSERVVKGFTD